MHQMVFMEWVQVYRTILIDALQPSGRVLEVGFSEAAFHIQQYKPKSHTIIEPDPKRLSQAEAFVQEYPYVTLIHDSWRDALVNLETFDAIYFNDYPPVHNEKETLAIVRTSKDLLQKAEEKIASLNVRYSDQEIEEFYQTIGQHHKEALPSFFKTLHKNGFISEAQYQNASQRYDAVENSSQYEPLLQFLLVAETHMDKGSRFSAFSLSSASKYDCPHFFEHVITNPSFSYEEKFLSLTGENSHLVMLVKKF
jgi:hypothetical protein